MRCLALAEAWTEIGGIVEFRTRTESESIDARLKEVGVVSTSVGEAGSSEDAEATASAALRLRAEWVALDGYSFGADFERRVAASGSKVMSLDDVGVRREFAGDAILNQNAYARESLYAGASLPRLRMFGGEFALLRKEFRRARSISRAIPDSPRHLLVSMGGGDCRGASLKVVHALRHMNRKDFEVVILVGPNNPALRALRGATACLDVPVRIEVGARDVASWMRWADIGILGAGTTVWESCCMGLPALLVCLAENQRGIIEWAERSGVSECLGHADSVTPEVLAERLAGVMADRGRRQRMSAVASAAIDGQGANRVRDTLLAEL